MSSMGVVLLMVALSGQVFAAPMRVIRRMMMPQSQPVATKADTAAYPRGAVFTIDNERFDGPIVALESGRLSIDSDPPRSVPLDEVERIEIGSSAQPTAVWLGQGNHDVAQPGANAGANGIGDVHLQCRGVAPGRTITQAVVMASIGGVPQVWMLEPNNTPFWRLASERTEGGDTAELYLEPPAGDCFGAQFDVTLSLDDNQSVKLNLKATTHTDAKLKAAPAEAPAGESAPAAALVLLDGGESIHGKLADPGKDAQTELLRVEVWLGQHVDIPLAQIRGCWLAANQPDERRKFDERLAAGGEKDWALITGRDQTIAAAEGNFTGLVDGKLELVVDGEARKVALGRVLGFVLASHLPRPAGDAFYQLFELDGGDRISGQLTGVGGQAIGLHTRWGTDLELPRSTLRSITCRNGRATYLSDLEPVTVEETPYFSRLLAYHRDESLDGGPLVLGGTTYRKGLAVHSRSRLTYALDGRFDHFQTRLGFDDGAPPGGAVACRVLADDRELLARPDLRPEAEPLAVNLDVRGAKQLVLEVDFGAGQDVGDRVVWAARGCSGRYASRLPPRPPNLNETRARRNHDRAILHGRTLHCRMLVSRPTALGRGR